jgi:hypothetical protein
VVTVDGRLGGWPVGVLQVRQFRLVILNERTVFIQWNSIGGLFYVIMCKALRETIYSDDIKTRPSAAVAVGFVY